MGVMMAVSGGMTTAYRCRIVDGQLQAKPATLPGSLCVDKTSDAIQALADGDTINVAGGDMAALQRALIEHGIRLGWGG